MHRVLSHAAPPPPPPKKQQQNRDLEIQLKTEQVHIAPASNKLAAHRTAGSYRNYGERLYVEGRLEAMKKEQLVGALAGGV
jgi:hypothetical protein